jgi:hypothetical protein
MEGEFKSRALWVRILYSDAAVMQSTEGEGARVYAEDEVKGIIVKTFRTVTSRFLLFTPLFLSLVSCASKDWRTASRESAGIAPNPLTTREAVVQVYGASTWGWRGWFAIHTWVATKPVNAESYTVYEVIGWRKNRGLPAMRIEKDLPDRYWFGERPRLLKEFRGEPAGKLVEAVDKAAKSYPWPDTYKAFPGPNSNTFTAWIAKQVPELGLDLPFSAIGSGYAETK